LGQFPASSADGNSSPNAQPVLGFVMSPFVDPATNKSFCPTFADYNDPTSSTAIQVMKDVVGIDTEGLYLGEKNVETAVIDGTTITSPPDYIVIKESTLKQIWFYFENEQAIAPNSITEGTKTLYFYYPPNFASLIFKEVINHYIRSDILLRLAQEIMRVMVALLFFNHQHNPT
jgi:hypothetical protein